MKIDQIMKPQKGKTVKKKNKDMQSRVAKATRDMSGEYDVVTDNPDEPQKGMTDDELAQDNDRVLKSVNDEAKKLNNVIKTAAAK